VFVPYRDDKLLKEAREKYGDEFVQWVLARQNTIVESMKR